MRLTLAVLAAVVLASPAGAAGINLSWDDCGAAGTAARTFACNTNSGDTFRLYASFVAPAGMDRLNGVESEIHFDFPGTSVPAWWDVHNAGSCRQTGLAMTATSFPLTCQDPWLGQLASGFAWTMGYLTPSRARFRMLGAMPSSDETVVPAGTEAFVYTIIINRQRSLNSTCGGCDVGGCITLLSIKLNELTDETGVIESTVLTNPALRQHVTWQAGYPPCPAATPTQSRSWGALKSLYR